MSSTLAKSKCPSVTIRISFAQLSIVFLSFFLSFLPPLVLVLVLPPALSSKWSLSLLPIAISAIAHHPACTYTYRLSNCPSSGDCSDFLHAADGSRTATSRRKICCVAVATGPITTIVLDSFQKLSKFRRELLCGATQSPPCSPLQSPPGKFRSEIHHCSFPFPIPACPVQLPLLQYTRITTPPPKPHLPA